MKANAQRDINAGAWPGANGRVQIRVGVHRFTATTDEAADLASQLVSAVDAIREADSNAI